MNRTDAFHLLIVLLLLGMTVCVWFMWERIDKIYAIAKRAEFMDEQARNAAMDDHKMEAVRRRQLDELDKLIDET